MPLKPRARQQNPVERQLSKIVTKDAYDTNFGGASAPLSTPLSTALSATAESFAFLRAAPRTSRGHAL